MSETSRDATTGAPDDEQQTLVGISFSDAFRAQEFLTAAFPLDRAADAHRDLEGRRTTGKVLLLPQG